MIGLFHKILVPVDFSPCSDAAFKTAMQLAHASKSELVMLHVIDTGAIAAFNRLGLLAVPSDATVQRRRLRQEEIAETCYRQEWEATHADARWTTEGAHSRRYTHSAASSSHVL